MCFLLCKSHIMFNILSHAVRTNLGSCFSLKSRKNNISSFEMKPSLQPGRSLDHITHQSCEIEILTASEGLSQKPSWPKLAHVLSSSIILPCSAVMCDSCGDPRCRCLMYEPWQACRGATCTKDSGKRKVVQWAPAQAGVNLCLSEAVIEKGWKIGILSVTGSIPQKCLK